MVTEVRVQIGSLKPTAANAVLMMSDPRTHGTLPHCRLIGSLGVAGTAIRERASIRSKRLGDAWLVGSEERTPHYGSPKLQGAVAALLAAVDAKDSYTAAHSRRVTRIALRLGRAAGLSVPALRLLEFAALTHDVGKIGVPEHVLRKPGRLTAEEWEEMRRHPVVSAEIVAHISDFKDVAAVVRHHHERYDGGGYPDRLVGDRIPYLARLLAVADTFDAMTSQRLYNTPLTPAEAGTVMQEGLGTQFDPGLGRLFLTLDLEAVWQMARGEEWPASKMPLTTYSLGQAA